MRVITIGTSQNGATSSEVDFLCSGTNDSQMIASAIDALPLTGGLIKFQPGTYNLTQEMVLDKESVTICGSGNSTVLKREYQSVNSDTALVKIEMDKCTIKDIYIHYGYNKRPTSSATSVKGIFSEGYFTTIQNVYFSNSKINLEDTLIDDIYAVHLTGTQSIVEDCIFEKNYSEEALRCVVCEGNDCIIANNRLHNLRGDTSTGGIYCSGSNCIIDSNTISGIITDGSVIGIRCAGNSCTIHGNTCIGSDSIIKTAIGFYIEGDNNTVSGNQIKSMISQQYSAQGIWSIGTGNTLSGNTCVDNYTNDSEKDGTNLYVNGDNNTVTGNTCTVTSSITTPFANIKIDSEKSIFVGNRAVIADGLAQNYTSEQYSIFLESNAYYNMITDNVCLGKDIAKLNPTQNDYNYIANNKTELEQVYEEKGISDAPSGNGVYGRKNGAWESITAFLDTKADKTEVETALVAKADKSYVDSALWDKADGAAVYEELDKKANQTDVTALENDLDTFYTDLNNLQSTAVTDAPSDGNTYARKDGAWKKLTNLTNLTSRQNSQLINFVPLEYNGSDVTDLDNLPNGITIVSYVDGPGAGGYMVMTALEAVSGLGYQIKMSVSGMSYRFSNGGGSWSEWHSIG